MILGTANAVLYHRLSHSGFPSSAAIPRRQQHHIIAMADQVFG